MGNDRISTSNGKAYIKEKERKVIVTYFDVNTGGYKSGEMYVPNYTVETKVGMVWNYGISHYVLRSRSIKRERE